MRRVAAALLIALAACSRPVAPPPGSLPPAQIAGVPPDPGARQETESPPPSKLDVYRLSEPARRGNLAVYVLRDPQAPAGEADVVTLEEALRSGALKVTEKGEGAEVDELHVENAGDRPVYLQAGDTVKGGQQDRTIAVDFILPPKSGKRTVDAFCVEPGRWAVREQTAAHLSLSGATFALAEESAPVASNAQKLAVRLSKSQADVWSAGKTVNAQLALKASPKAEPKDSYVEAVEDPAVVAKVNEMVEGLRKAADGAPDAVGAAFWVNGKLQNVEIYGTPGLFRKLWPKLLRAAAVDAISKSQAAEPPAPPSGKDLQALLASFAGRTGKAERRPDGPVVRVFERDHAVLFDTEHRGALLHRQLLTK